MKQDNLTPEDQHDFLSWEKGKNRGKLITGILIILFGVLFLMREMDVNIPRWIFSAPTILMAIGLVIFSISFKKLRVTWFLPLVLSGG